ncbi:Leucine carboxyl methyltransferase 1, partial [Trichinella nelsoni]
LKKKLYCFWSVMVSRDNAEAPNLDETCGLEWTNEVATDWKAAAVKRGYWVDPFIYWFQQPKQNILRFPEMLRGYYARVKGIRIVVEQFLDKFGPACQIINFGAGFDTMYWNLSKEGRRIDLYLEIDLPDVVRKKINCILRHSSHLYSFACNEQLQMLIDHNDVMHALNYHIMAGDLCNTDDLMEKFLSIPIDFSKPTLFLSECVLVYVDVDRTKNLLHMLSNKFAKACFLDYEPSNLNSIFGRKFLENMAQMKVSVSGAPFCESVDSMRQIYVENGWSNFKSWKVSGVYLNFLPRQDRERMETLDLLDDPEMLKQMLDHYLFSVATNCNDQNLISIGFE